MLTVAGVSRCRTVLISGRLGASLASSEKSRLMSQRSSRVMYITTYTALNIVQELAHKIRERCNDDDVLLSKSAL